MILRLRQLCNHQSLAIDYDNCESQTVSTTVSKDGDIASISASLSRISVEKSHDASLLERHPVDIKGKQVYPSAKIVKILEILTAEPRKTVIFSSFVKFIDILSRFLHREGIRQVRLTGEMTLLQRDTSIDTLICYEGPIVILSSLKTASLGLNLTAADRVILVDPWWNPMISQQAIDRVHRIGQFNDVDVYELCVAGSVEENIYELQDKKRKLADSVLNGDKQVMKSLEKLTKNEMAALLNH